MKTSLVAALMLAVASSASAQTFDHLECYAIKDSLARGTARADLVPETPPFLAGLGCRIKLPARELCTRTAKQNLQPPPSLTIGGDEPGEYLCYRIACPRGADLRGASLQSADQFGSRTIAVRKPQRLCVPANRPTATPTPTPVVEPSAGTPVPTITPGIHDPGCSFDGTECQGGCSTSGRCVWYPSQQRCICPPVFDADCNHAIGGCAPGLCFGPGQVCRAIPQPSGQFCGCVSATPTPVPTP